MKNDLHQQLVPLQNKIQEEEAKLQSLEAKQLAYIKAQQREKEIEQKQDYYRLNISDTDVDDIKLLRNLQVRFVKKESIDKLIWEVYYKSAYNILMSHLFKAPNKVCGIYKITDVITKQAYIGQSVKYRPVKNFS